MRRGVAYSALGWGLPAVLALASVPALTRMLGPDRFGLLAIAWAAVAAFGVLDLGLGRATTLLVARARGGDSVASVVAAGGAWMWLLFGPVAIAGWFAAPWIARDVLTLPDALREEAVGVLRLLAITLPVAAHGVMLRAALEGQARWGLVNAFRAPLGIITWGGPWLVAMYTTDVRALVAVIFLGRALYWLVQWHVLDWAWREPCMRLLLRDGGWMTVSAMVTPVLSLVDRAVIAGRLPIADVGWYVATAETAGKFSIIGAILQPMLFQGMVAARAQHEPLGPWLRRGSKWTIAMILPPALFALWFAPQVLPWWLADSFTPAAVTAFRVFVLAMLANAMALVAYAALHAMGRARPVAIVHAVQLPLYGAALWWAAVTHGAAGVALVWSLRNVLDAAALWLLLASTAKIGRTAEHAA